MILEKHGHIKCIKCGKWWKKDYIDDGYCINCQLYVTSNFKDIKKEKDLDEKEEAEKRIQKGNQ